MNKILFILMAVLSVATSANAQNDAMYVYRNDGGFNAFLKSEVDSMICSHFDVDSVYHQEWQMQVIYTPDSIYKIPLALIDSISFVTPTPVVNKNVFQLTTMHDPYLSECDTLHFTLALSTPTDLQPIKGNIVVSKYDCASFPNGIMARVISIEEDESGTHYNCEKVGIESVFDKLIFTGYGYVDTEYDNQFRRMAKAPHSFTKIFWNETWTKDLSYSGTTTNMSANDKAYAKFTVDIELGKPSFLSVELTNELETSFKFNATNSFAKWYEKPLGNINLGKIPLPYTFGLLWITPKLSLSAYFAEEAKLSLDFEAHFNRTDNVTFTHANSQWEVDYTYRNDAAIDVASLSMDGYMEVGLIPNVLLSFNGSGTGIGFETTAGLRENVHFKFDALDYYDEEAYSALKDSYARTTIPQEVKAYAQVELFDEGTRPFSGTIYKGEIPWGPIKYILPMFEKPKYTKGNTSTTAMIKSDISRDLLLPVNVGIVYYHGDTRVKTDYKSIPYQDKKRWTLNGLQSSFTDMVLGDTYTAYPIVKIMGKELRAVPSCKFPQILSCPDDYHPHVIDLGLPSGTRWYCCNEGASSPTKYGNYYAWGESSSKASYRKDNYEYHHTSEKGKYVYDDTSYSIAPSQEQVNELLHNCIIESITIEGVRGDLLTGPNGNTIFLPYAGAKSKGLYGAGTEWQFWTNKLDTSSRGNNVKARKTPDAYKDDEEDEDEGHPYAYDWKERDLRYIGKTIRRAR